MLTFTPAILLGAATVPDTDVTVGESGEVVIEGVAVDPTVLKQIGTSELLHSPGCWKEI